jgi:hypothetical protein
MRIAISLALVCGCVFMAQAREEYRRDFSRIVALTAGHSFRIENSYGNVTIHTRPNAEASIRAVIQCSAPTADEARRCADRIQITVDEGGGNLSVRTEFPSTNHQSNIGFGVNYDLEIPEAAPLEVRNRFGSVNLSGPRAGATVVNGNGNVTLSTGRGRQQIENSFGSVEVRGNDGDVIVRNTNGGVTASDISGTLDIADRFGKVHVTNANRGLTIHSDNGEIEATSVGGVATISNSFGPVVVWEARSDLNVHNQNGGITANGVSGAADLETTFGHVQCARIGKSLTVHAQNTGVTCQDVGAATVVETTFATVDLRDVKGGARVTAGNSPIKLVSVAGEIYAKTSFAEVRLDSASGPVTVENNNGSVFIDAHPARPGVECQPISVRTSFSPIRVAVPEGGPGYQVNASTSFGSVRTEHEMRVTGELAAGTLHGRIGNGSCPLRLNDQNGNIEILKSINR